MDRIDAVEVKIAFLEHHISELDGVVRQLADDLRRLRTELADLRDSSAPDGKPGDEKPPHY